MAADDPRGAGGRRHWIVTAGIVALLLVALVVVPAVRTPGEDPDAPAAEGGGQPHGIVPPFEETQDAPEITSLHAAGLAVCDLRPAVAGALASGDVEASPVTDTSCVYTFADADIELVVELLDQAFADALAGESDRWPQGPEIRYEPALSGFLLDADRSALLVNAGDATLALRLRATAFDRVDHLDRLLDLLEALGQTAA